MCFISIQVHYTYVIHYILIGFWSQKGLFVRVCVCARVVHGVCSFKKKCYHLKYLCKYVCVCVLSTNSRNARTSLLSDMHPSVYALYMYATIHCKSHARWTVVVAEDIFCFKLRDCEYWCLFVKESERVYI